MYSSEKATDIAIKLAIDFEGFSNKPYLCPAGYWTIGFGHLCAQDHPIINREQGLIYLRSDVADAMRSALRLCPILTTSTPERLAAITDFVFNIGAGRLQTSTLRRKVNATDWSGACVELKKWVHVCGRVLPGLVGRRQAEIALILA